MDFFDKLGKKATEAYKVTADKTGKIAKETKNKFKIGELRTQVNDLYEEIGKKIYEKHVIKGTKSIKDELEEECTKIDVINDEIESLLKECLELNDKKQCPKCFTEIEKENKFCPKCGEKQEEIKETENEEPAKEVEIVEDTPSKETENKQEKEEVESIKKENKTNKKLKETVEIESDVNLNDKTKNQEIKMEEDK